MRIYIYYIKPMNFENLENMQTSDLEVTKNT